MPKQSYGDRLRSELKRLGWTSNRAARESGVPQPTVYLFMKGECGLHQRNFERLCRAVGLDLRPTKRKSKPNGNRTGKRTAKAN